MMRLYDLTALAALLSFIAGAICPAQTIAPLALPPGGEDILPANAVTQLQLRAAPDLAKMELLTPEDGPFGHVLRVETLRRTTNTNQIALHIPNAGPITGRDVLFVCFYARTTKTTAENGQGRMLVRFDHATPGQGNVAFPHGFYPGAEWEPFWRPIAGSRGNFAPGEAVLKIELGASGTGVQTIEIADLRVVNFKRSIKESDLPFMKRTYVGREPDAPWRQPALERIETIRKGDLTLTVLDAQGQPLPNAKVKVTMTRHAYKFGSAIGERFILGKTETSQTFRNWFLKLFNTASIENAIKWQNFVREDRRQVAERILREVLIPNDILHHSHLLIWPSWKYAPPALREMRNDKEAVRNMCEQRIVETIQWGKQFGLKEWQVVNELEDNNEIPDMLGNRYDVVAGWYKLAAQTDPSVKLYINENGILAGNKAKAYEKTIRELLARGARIDGIGFQGHVGQIPIQNILERLDHFQKTFNLPILITEYDTVTPDKELQGDFTRDFMIAVFSHPATEGFIMWGFWDGAQWLNDAPLFFEDWTLKPAGKAYIDLVLNQWWTQLDGSTDAKGQYQGRAFFGKHQIEVTLGDTTQSLQVDFTSSGSHYEIRMP